MKLLITLISVALSLPVFASKHTGGKIPPGRSLIYCEHDIYLPTAIINMNKALSEEILTIRELVDGQGWIQHLVERPYSVSSPSVLNESEPSTICVTITKQ